MSAKSLNVASLVKAIMDKDHTRADALVRSGQIDLNAKHGPNGRTALMYACEVGNSRIARLLLLKGAEVDISDDMNEDTALHIASAKDESCVRCLLEYRANVNLKTKNDQTPLYQAVAEGHEEIVRLLLEHRADINAKNKRMNTPLHWASLYNKITIAQLLMEHNPDLTVRNREGRTPVDIARSKSFDQMACVLESKTDAARQLGSEYLTVINTPSPEAGRETIPNPLQEATEYVKPISLKSSPYSCSTPPSDSENRQDTVDGYGIIVRDNPHPVEHECPSREISAEDIYTPAGVTQRKTPQTVLRRTTDERVDKMEREVHRLQEQLRSSNIVSPKVFRRISSLEEMVADVYNKDMNTGWENTRQKFPQGQVPTGRCLDIQIDNIQTYTNTTSSDRMKFLSYHCFVVSLVFFIIFWGKNAKICKVFL